MRKTNCSIMNQGLTEKEKNLILKLHNDYREKVASGAQTTEGTSWQPPATNMRQLEWDDELANLAQKQAETCNVENKCDECLKVDRFDVVGQNIYEASSAIFPNLWKEMMREFRQKSYSYHSQIVWADTWKMGCGKVEIGYESRETKPLIVCNYAPGRNNEDQPFKTGDPCTQCPSGTCCGGHCSVRLAFQTFPPSLCRVDTCRYEKFTSEHIGCKPKNPKCKSINNRVTMEERALVVTLLNQYRDDVAQGKVTVDKKLPPAANMNKLYWGFELAMLAQRHAETCNKEEDCPECRKTDRFNVGQIIYTSSSTNFPSEFENMVKSSIKIPDYFNQIIWAETFRVGCGKVVVEEGFDFKTMIVCNFGPGAHRNHTTPEEVPAPYISTRVDDDSGNGICSKCPDGFCCGPSCEKHGIRNDFTALCKLISIETAEPKNVTKEPSTIVTVRPKTVLKASKGCDYKKFSPYHSACKPRSSNCDFENNMVTDEDKTEILKLHNDYRNKIAMAIEAPSNGSMNSSSNMRELEWDDELAHIAQKHAETCTPDYDCDNCRRVDRFRVVGQAIYEASSATFPMVWEEMMASFREKHPNQLIWADTYKMGCGKVEIQFFGQGKALIVCNYGPGARVGVAPFQSGEPCSDCPLGTCCGDYCGDGATSNSSYPGLCKVKECEYEKFTPDHIGCRFRNPNCSFVKNDVRENEKILILKLHNDYREKVAEGADTKEASGWQPPAANMRQMEWDNELGSLAQKHAETCDAEYACDDCLKVDRFDVVRQNIYEASSANFPNVWEEMMREFRQKSYSHNSQILWADTWKMGCGKVEIEGESDERKVLIVCNYAPGGNKEDQPFQPGDPCTECPSGTCCRDHCTVGTTSQNFFASLCRKEPCIYEKFTPEHIGCKPKNPSCQVGNHRVTTKERKLITSLLNQYRENAARGKVIVNEKKMPAATNMNKLYWDDELALLAQRHAETCNKVEDCPECRQTDAFNVGQIIYTSNSTDFPKEWENMVKSSILIPDYFIQIVWAQTFRIGCGKVEIEKGNFQFKTMIVCNFGPDVNRNYPTSDGVLTPYKAAREGYLYRGCTGCSDGFCCGSKCSKFGIRDDFTVLCRLISMESVVTKLVVKERESGKAPKPDEVPESDSIPEPDEEPESVSTMEPVKVTEPEIVTTPAPVTEPEIVTTEEPVKVTEPEIVTTQAPVKKPEIVTTQAPVKKPSVVATRAPAKKKEPCKYDKFTPEHIGCKSKNPSCKVVNNGVTKDDRILVLKRLNEFRDQVALGKFGPRGFEMLAATDMRELEWDDELAMLAQKHAETCNKDKVCSECRKTDRFDVGQIIQTSSSTDFSNVLEEMFTSFFKDYERFMQIIWATTWRVGCGKVVVEEGSFDGKTMLVCNFGPESIPGFMSGGGSPPYKTVYKNRKRYYKPCGQCPEDTCCGSSCSRFRVRSDYKALCKSTIK